MPTIVELEQAILQLPPQQFHELLGWMNHRGSELAQEEEDPALEEALLRGMEGARIPVTEAFWDGIRQQYRPTAK